MWIEADRRQSLEEGIMSARCILPAREVRR